MPNFTSKEFWIGMLVFVFACIAAIFFIGDNSMELVEDVELSVKTVAIEELLYEQIEYILITVPREMVPEEWVEDQPDGSAFILIDKQGVCHPNPDCRPKFLAAYQEDFDRNPGTGDHIVGNLLGLQMYKPLPSSAISGERMYVNLFAVAPMTNKGVPAGDFWLTENFLKDNMPAAPVDITDASFYEEGRCRLTILGTRVENVDCSTSGFEPVGNVQWIGLHPDSARSGATVIKCSFAGCFGYPLFSDQVTQSDLELLKNLSPEAYDKAHVFETLARIFD